MGAQPDAATATRAERLGKRIGHGLVIAVAVLFIGASSMQIIPAVFGFGQRPIMDSERDPDARACAIGVRRLALALDHASNGAGSQGGAGIDRSRELFRRALSPDWDDADAVRRACEQSAEGLDAWAALLRLRDADEQFAMKDRAELGTLRRDVAAHLPPDLR
jgi:hypothetical protein